MKKSTMSIIRYVRDILLVLIFVVILARSGNMPVVIPEKINDFIIDTTEAFLSGNFFHSFRGFMNDTADYVNVGEKAVDLKKELNSYHSLLNNYFLSTKKNLLFLASRYKIRASLPDFKKSLTTVFAQNILAKIIKDYHDVDQISLIKANKEIVLTAKRPKIARFNEKKLDLAKIKELSKVQGVKTFILKDNRFCLVTHVFSAMREKEGYLVLVLNKNQLSNILSQRQQNRKNYFPFIYNKRGLFFVEGVKSKGLSLLKKKLFESRVSLESLKSQTYLDLGEKSYRIALQPLLVGHSLQVGLVGLEGSIIPFLLLIARCFLLLFAIWVLIYLVRLIYRTILEIVKHEKLADDFNELLLKKSLDTNRKVLNAAEISYKKTVAFVDNLNKSNENIKQLMQKKGESQIKNAQTIQEKMEHGDVNFLEIPFSENSKEEISNSGSSLSLTKVKNILQEENCPGYPDFKDDYVSFAPIVEKTEDLKY